MKKKLSMLLCGIMVTAGLAGCAGGEPASTSRTPESAGQQETADRTNAEETSRDLSEDGNAAGESVELKVWHDGDEAIMDTVQSVVNVMLEKDHVTVSFEKKSGLTDQLQLYGNDAKNGPDLYFYAHDSLGTFVEMGILAPVGELADTSVTADLLPMTVKAGAYQGSQYMIPVYFETLLFMYNKGLWEGEVPSTTEELYAYMEAHTDTAAGTYAVVNQHSTAYNVSPFIYGYGGYIINDQAQPGLNGREMVEAVTYNQKFAALQADGDYNTVTTLFNEGKAAAIIGGPWLVSGIRDAGIDLGVKSLADFTLPNGKQLAPFSGVQGIGVMKHAAENKKDAVAAVLRAAASPEVGIELAKTANCAPANSKSYDDPEVASNEMIAAIRNTAETAQPMPNIPQMSVMWGPAEGFLAAVNKSGEDVQSAADKYQKEAETAIADMQ